jgi:Ca2+-binding RTX toxin-like protein
LSRSDIELVWEFTEVGGTSPSSYGDYDDYYRTGQAAIRIIATGETLYLGELSYNRSDYMARYELYFLSNYSRDYDKALARLASGGPTGYGPGNSPSWAAYTNNDQDDEENSVELAIFSFDGVTRLNIFDLFDLSAIVSQELPSSVKAAAGILGRLGQAGDESLTTGTPGDDDLAGGPGDDDLFSGDGDDVIDAGGGDDIVRAGAGNDLIVGGPGSDSYDGGSGDDTIDFGWTAAGVTVDLASGIASGPEIGSDSVAGIENVIGGGGADRLSGDGSANRLAGGAGADVLEGRGGGDELDGGAGADRLEGGAGWDSYVWRPGDGSDEIIDQAQGGYAENTLRVEGAALADFTIRRDPVTLDGALTLNATGETILIRGMFAGGGKGVAQFDFRPGADLLHYYLADLAALAVDDPTLGGGLAGTAGDDALVGTSGDDRIYGLGGDDVLTGLDGKDHLDGGTGADRMVGGKGDDVYIVGESGDVVVETALQGDDEVRTTLANYILPANVERLTGLLSTGQTLVGNSLANVLTGGGGPDVLNGGAGVDTASWKWSVAGMIADLQTGETGGDSAGDVLISIENLTGGSGNDTLRGNSAANLLDGGPGADIMTGRSGNDVYVVDDPADQVVEAPGGGTDQVRSKLNLYALPDNVENLKFAGSGGFEGLGNDLHNLIEGGDGDDLLNGAAGVDTLLGRGGNDHLIGGSDGDVLDGGPGPDMLEGGPGNDVYLVDNAGDAVVELAGDGADQVLTTLLTYQLPEHVESLSANGAGNFHLIGNGADNLIAGTGGDDLLDGGDGHDELRGNSGNDTLVGGAGNDRLVGGAGTDVMTGGAGNDIFQIGGWETGLQGDADVITDFTVGEDLIDLSGMDADLWQPGRQAFTLIGSNAFSASAGELRMFVGVGETWIEGDIDGDGVADFAIMLAGEVPLGPGDFLA